MTTAYFSHPDCRAHDMGAGHPECPQRLDAIEDHLISTGLDIALTRFDPPLAKHSDLMLAHSENYLLELDEFMQQATLTGEHRALDPDTMVCPHTWQAALRAAGAAVAATDAVIDRRAENAFCAIRPPGHHATRSETMGFCFFNNIAIAARHALDVRGLERVAIVDFDVHHGNGTQAIFYNDPRVAYFSSHESGIYPHSGAPYERGAGNVFNALLPPGSGGFRFQNTWADELLPALDDFKPQLLLISAGFDAHMRDPLADLMLETEDFGWLTRQLRTLAQRHAGGRVVSMLEGGYDLDALRDSVAAHVDELR